MDFRLGCAIWAYKGWLGDLFPSGTAPAQFLSLYSRYFSTVECNATFYAIPSSETVRRWAQKTPPGFQFCPKLPRTITHGGTLQARQEDALRFMERMQGLGDRLGPMFAQLPPTYSPQSFQDLETFLEKISTSGSDLALEVRHPHWFQSPHAERLNQLLQHLSIGRVLLDTRPIYDCEDDPQLTAERRKPKLPLQPVVTAPFSLIRYISHPNCVFNRSFMEDWVSFFQDALQRGTRLHLFVHCPVEEKSPQNARYFQKLLEGRSLPIPPLPWTQVPERIPEEPIQLGLF